MKPTLGMLEAIAERYHDKIKMINDEESPIGESNFKHRVGGAGIAILNPEVASRVWNKNKSSYRKALKGLKAYFILLNENKDFRNAELYTHEGFLNELYIPFDDYIRASRAKLNGENSGPEK